VPDQAGQSIARTSRDAIVHTRASLQDLLREQRTGIHKMTIESSFTWLA
jgi:hypothetical protein